MKRLIKRLARPFWRMTAPIRRPIARRLDSRMGQMVASAIRSQVLPPIQESLESSSRTLERLEASLGASNFSAHLLATDVDLMLGSIVREVARLQEQVESLQDAMARTSSPLRSGLSLVETDEDGEPIARPAGVERSRVG